MTQRARVAILVLVIRQALEELDEGLQTKLCDPRLTASLGRFISPMMPFVLLGALALAAVSVGMLLLGFESAVDVLLAAIGLAAGFTFLGMIALSTLAIADVGWSAAEVVRDSVREARELRRHGARPEAGQLTFGEEEASAGLSYAEDEVGRVAVADPGGIVTSDDGSVRRPLPAR